MAKVEYVNDMVTQRAFDDAVLKVVITKCRVVEYVFVMELRGLHGSLILPLSIESGCTIPLLYLYYSNT